MIRDAPVGDPIPELTDAQHSALREYTERHRTAPEKLAPHPMTIARVVAQDRPAAHVTPITGVVPSGSADHDEYLPDVFGRMGLHTCQMEGDDGWYVARTAWRLDLLPPAATFTAAYHRRCGVFFGYPPDAVDWFIEHPDVHVTHCDIGRSGIIPPEDVAYEIFIPYMHKKSIERYADVIAKGKAIRRRITELSSVWDLSGLDAHAQAVYDDVATVYAGGEGLFNAPMRFPPDVDVTPRDVEPLLS